MSPLGKVPSGNDINEIQVICNTINPHQLASRSPTASAGNGAKSHPYGYDRGSLKSPAPHAHHTRWVRGALRAEGVHGLKAVDRRPGHIHASSCGHQVEPPAVQTPPPPGLGLG